MKNTYKKANQKLNALARITKFTSNLHRKTLLHSFIKSQFSYCPLIWMFTSKGLNKNIKQNSWKISQIVLNDHQSTLEETLGTLNQKTIHQKCIDSLLTKLYKLLNGYSTDIMNDVFHLRQNTYNLQNFHALATDVPRNICMLNHVAYRANHGKSIMGNLAFGLEKIMLARIIQKRIKKLVLH